MLKSYLGCDDRPPYPFTFDNGSHTTDILIEDSFRKRKKHNLHQQKAPQVIATLGFSGLCRYLHRYPIFEDAGC